VVKHEKKEANMTVTSTSLRSVDRQEDPNELPAASSSCVVDFVSPRSQLTGIYRAKTTVSYLLCRLSRSLLK
jgi:hypothetical protein